MLTGYIACTLLGAALVALPLFILAAWVKSLAVLYYARTQEREPLRVAKPKEAKKVA